MDVQQWILDNVPAGPEGILYSDLHKNAPFEVRGQLYPQLTALTRRGLTREVLAKPAPGQKAVLRVFRV